MQAPLNDGSVFCEAALSTIVKDVRVFRHSLFGTGNIPLFQYLQSIIEGNNIG